MHEKNLKVIVGLSMRKEPGTCAWTMWIRPSDILLCHWCLLQPKCCCVRNQTRDTNWVVQLKDPGRGGAARFHPVVEDEGTSRQVSSSMRDVCVYRRALRNVLVSSYPICSVGVAVIVCVCVEFWAAPLTDRRRLLLAALSSFIYLQPWQRTRNEKTQDTESTTLFGHIGAREFISR